MSQIFDLGPGYIFKAQTVNNSEKIVFQKFLHNIKK